MMPSSRKGKGVKRIERKPVPITSSLAAQLRQAAGNRARTQPLLLRTDGAPWQPPIADYRLPFIRAVTRVGLDPTMVTLYSLRHSSIVRALLAGVPTRVVRSPARYQHRDAGDAPTRSHILDHSDAVARRGLLDTAQPAAGTVVSLPGR